MREMPTQAWKLLKVKYFMAQTSDTLSATKQSNDLSNVDRLYVLVYLFTKKGMNKQ